MSQISRIYCLSKITVLFKYQSGAVEPTEYISPTKDIHHQNDDKKDTKQEHKEILCERESKLSNMEPSLVQVQTLHKIPVA